MRPGWLNSSECVWLKRIRTGHMHTLVGRVRVSTRWQPRSRKPLRLSPIVPFPPPHTGLSSSRALIAHLLLFYTHICRCSCCPLFSPTLSCTIKKHTSCLKGKLYRWTVQCKSFRNANFVEEIYNFYLSTSVHVPRLKRLFNFITMNVLQRHRPSSFSNLQLNIT